MIEHMMTDGEPSISVEHGMEILADVTCQRNVPDDEVAPFTMRELCWLRVLATQVV